MLRGCFPLWESPGPEGIISEEEVTHLNWNEEKFLLSEGTESMEFFTAESSRGWVAKYVQGWEMERFLISKGIKDYGVKVKKWSDDYHIRSAMISLNGRADSMGWMAYFCSYSSSSLAFSKISKCVPFIAEWWWQRWRSHWNAELKHYCMEYVLGPTVLPCLPYSCDSRPWVIESYDSSFRRVIVRCEKPLWSCNLSYLQQLHVTSIFFLILVTQLASSQLCNTIDNNISVKNWLIQNNSIGTFKTVLRRPTAGDPTLTQVVQWANRNFNKPNCQTQLKHTW